MYRRIIRTVVHIEGVLRPGFDAFDGFLSHVWAFSVTGASRTWAIQFFEDNEDAPRRWYGGAVGKIGFDGSMNTGLTLRTAHISGGGAPGGGRGPLPFAPHPAPGGVGTPLQAPALVANPAQGGEAAPPGGP